MHPVLAPGFPLAAAVAMLVAVPLATGAGLVAAAALGLPADHPAAGARFAAAEALLVSGLVVGAFAAASRLPRLPRLAALVGSLFAVGLTAASAGAGLRAAFPAEPEGAATAMAITLAVGAASVVILWRTTGRRARAG